MKSAKKKIVNRKKTRKINPNYLPKSLSTKDRKMQLNSILEMRERPKVASFKSKRSPYIVRFEKKYGFKISDFNKIHKNIMKKQGINKIINKGRGAYYSSGSRPNQTADSWARARLASVILFGNAFRVDKDIALKYGRKHWLSTRPSKYMS